VGAIVLDFLLVIVFLMMVPIGFYRGGLRELCVSAGLLLGIMMSDAWAARWSGLYERLFGMSEGSATFLMGVTVAFLIMALIGYGGSAVLTYQPGPGGRLYGAYLALFNAMIVAGYLINLFVTYIRPSADDEAVTTGIVARTLSDGFGSVLLVATVGIAIATVLGMFVRDRAAEPSAWQPQQQLYQPPADTRPYRVDGDDQPTAPSSPVRIREVASWQDGSESSRPDPSKYGSGWRQTWPDATPAQQRNMRRANRVSHGDDQNQAQKPEDPAKSVLAEWINDQEKN
jgi:hypothetical protein